MKPFFATWLPRLGLGALSMLGAATAQATLGQAPSSAAGLALSAAPSARMLAAARVTRRDGYAVHETVLASGTTLREYATPQGTVFALGWRGPALPDLPALLGSYFSAFKLEAEQARQSGRRGSLNLLRDGLVLQSQGRMGNFVGQAYAPSLVPSGVVIDDVFE